MPGMTDKMTSLDQELLALLRTNARASIAELAHRLGVSRGTVTNRIARMEDAGIIVGYTVRLRPDVQPNEIGAWMSMIALVLSFVTDLHHLMLRGLVESYALFRPADVPPIGDFTELIVRLVSSTFLLGIRIATPFLAFGFIFNLALGLVARLMPQVQVFFVAMPLQIVIGLIALGSTVGIGMVIFLNRFESVLTTFSMTR